MRSCLLAAGAWSTPASRCAFPPARTAASRRVPGSRCLASTSPDYNGTLRVRLANHTDEPYTVKVKQRIAQLVLERIAVPQVRVVDSVERLGETARGAGGFGSTGV